MSENKYAVQVKGVKKSFILPHHKNNSLKSAITQVFKPKQKGSEVYNALDGISFNVEKGDFFGILGRNGSGKSTLLKIISEIYQPTAGNVKTHGKVVSFIELGVGFKSELSGRENVFLNGALLGFSKQEIEAMYDDIVAFAELEQFMDQKLKNYSSGMKVRLAFSVAIRAKADILILDEVLAVGDASFQKKCTDYFETLKDNGKTVILVTHSMGNVRRFCNRAILIDGGRVISEGDAEVVAGEYTALFEDKNQNKIKPPSLDLSRDVAITRVSVDLLDNKIIYSINLLNKTNEKMDIYLAVDIYRVGGQLIGGLEKVFFSIESGEALTKQLTVQNIFGSGEFSANIGVRSRKGGALDVKRRVCLFSNISKNDANGILPIILGVDEDTR